MDIGTVKSRVRGPLAPVLTVYKEDLSLDLDAIQENVDQQIRRGLGTGQGVLLAAGAGGDFPLLTHDERKAVIQAVAAAAGDRAVVLGTVQSPATREAVELAEWSQQVGCYGVQLSPTWYYDPDESQVYELFKTVSQSIDICIMIYHTPWLGSRLSPAMFLRLATDFPNCRAIKWAADTAGEAIRGYIELADHYAMINNGAGLLEGILLGANGFVTHLANVWPEHEVALWDMAARGDIMAVRDEWLRVNWPWSQLRSWAYNEIARGESLLVKPAADMTGFHGGPSRPPFVNFTAAQKAHVRAVLQEMGAPLVD